LVYIIIEEEFIQEKKLTIIKNNEEEKEFIKELKARIDDIKPFNIYSHETLEAITQKFASIAKELWCKHCKSVNITKQSKTW